VGPISGNKVDKQAPSVTIVAPSDKEYLLGEVVVTDYQCTDGGSGMVSCSGPVANGGTLGTSTVGTRTFTVETTDAVGNRASQSVSYRVVYRFSGFFQPVDTLPTLNAVKAGQAIPIKWSLSGNHGLNILAAGSPKSERIACDSSLPVDGIEEMVTVEASGLSYDASIDQYRYVWKTDKAWAGTCRQFVLQLADGTYHRTNFTFTR